MPRTPIDYSNTIIYKIVCNDLNITDCYVGHTTEFTKRKSKHRYNTINEKSKDSNAKVYKTIRDNGGWENWSMIEIEKFSCCDANEARARERHWYELLNAQLNMMFPCRTDKEYYETNSAKIKAKVNKYRLENQDKIKEMKKNEYIKNSDAIKARVKEYSINNKDKVMNNKKLYYEKNKVAISEYKKKWHQANKAKKATLAQQTL